MGFRRVHAHVDLDAVRANVRTLAGCAGDAALMAVVKADAYGHGAVAVARAALDAGATWLGVALVEEGMELRTAGIESRIVLLSEPPVDAAIPVVEHDLTPVVYRERWIDALAEAATRLDRTAPLPVHLKVDTGMHRVGCDIDDAVAVAQAVRSRPALRLEGLMTHLAVADEPDHPATDEQVACFESVRRQLEVAGLEPEIVHAANSAATLVRPDARYDLVRCGIALYGIAPSDALDGAADLRPVMSLHAPVAQVRRVRAGEGISYGLRYRPERDTTVVTVPIGYGDGVPRRLGSVGGEVLVGGRRRPIAGTITMDQLMVDCGDPVAGGEPVAEGDPVVLLGEQGAECIRADEWARLLDTIGYEITCGIGARVPRTYT